MAAKSIFAFCAFGLGFHMRLIGQFDSPFVRRVAVALETLAIRYEHLPWSVFADAERIAAYNPLRRVPVLIVPDGEPIIESGAIIDWIEHLSSRSLWPSTDEAQRAATRIAAVATGAAEKAVSLVYEQRLHAEPSPQWTARCAAQIGDGLDELERKRAAARTIYLFGDDIGHADIALACLLRFVREAHAGMFDLSRWPALRHHSDICEALPAFRAVSQPFSIAV